MAMMALLLAAVPVRLAHAKHARESELPERYRKKPYSLMSLSVGHPNRGWQVRAKRLRKSRFIAIKDSSRKTSYGHPALVKMLHRAARDLARSAAGTVMLVGDLTRKDGGPLVRHVSHQSGRDADIGFFALNRKGKPVKLTRFIAFRGDGSAKDDSSLRFDDWRNWLLVQGWLRDRRAEIQHVFVSRPLRKRLLRYARSQKRFRKYVERASVLLREPSDSSRHDDHFHVRIACPAKQRDICMPTPKR
jgi:penicillin-insensitive murein endopeptidase